MNLFYWLTPGIGIKRWVMAGIIGIVLLIMGLNPIIHKATSNISNFSNILLIIIGIAVIYCSINRVIIFILEKVRNSEVSLAEQFKLDRKNAEKKLLDKGPKMVVLGGGTGLSVLLRGVKNYTSNITAIVTVADDGGGSGKLREDLGMLPPGDIRNCILALADTEPIMEQLLQYRFEEGSLKGQCFGNLLIAAMNGISGNFEEAIQKINDVLAVTGKVLPVSLDDIILYAKLKNGKLIKGESQIPKKVKELESEIDHVFIEPQDAKPVLDAMIAIEEADVIILGPGSLYTSILPNLLVKEVALKVKASKGIKIYVANVMTQPGETDGYGAWQHISAIIKHAGSGLVDYVMVNNEEIPQVLLDKYGLDGATPVMISDKDRKLFYENGIKIIEVPLVDIKKDYVRHDANKVCQIITRLLLEEKFAKEKNLLWDYCHFNDKYI